MSDRSVSSIKQLVSSANKIDVRRVDTLHKSLIYSKNSDGPRIEPCGTPQETGACHSAHAKCGVSVSGERALLLPTIYICILVNI